MYDVEYINGKWWITRNGQVIEMLGSFTDPISPKIIAEEIEKHG